MPRVHLILYNSCGVSRESFQTKLFLIVSSFMTVFAVEEICIHVFSAVLH